MIGKILSGLGAALIISLAAVLIVKNFKTEKETTGMKEITSQEELDEIINTTSDKVVLVDFYATWCGPCKMLSKELEKLQQEMSDKIKIVKVNGDENPEILEKHGVRAYPTLAYYKDKEIKLQEAGYRPFDALVKTINSL